MSRFWSLGFSLSFYVIQVGIFIAYQINIIEEPNRRIVT
jgi:hypothetical protein